MVEISTASREQSLGVGQVSHAMNQLETVTNQNSAVAQASSTAGEQLRQQADTINRIVKNLNSYIRGEGRQHVKPAAPSRPLVQPMVRKPVSQVTDKKVLKYERKKSVTPMARKKVSVDEDVVEYKKAAGYDGKTPSGDDPGFRE